MLHCQQKNAYTGGEIVFWMSDLLLEPIIQKIHVLLSLDSKVPRIEGR